MVKQKIKKIVFLLSSCFSFYLMSCANQQPPSGGPLDTTPPKVEEVVPANGTTNFSEDYFELGFSEYVDKRSLKDAIFISPQIEGDLELDWSGASVRVYFPTKLKANITYNVTIGTDLVDFNNKNRMADAFSFSFSTGSKIDNGIISGNVYSDKPSGVMIFAYKVTGDTIDPVKMKADYVSQVGEKGNYSLSGLAFNTYRVFAVKDEYRDFLFQPDQDLIGVPFQDVTLTEKDTLYSGLNFSLTKIDTVSPRLFTAVMTDKYHLLVSFSEALDSASVDAKKFSIYDSTANKEYPVLFAYKGRAKEKELILAVKDSFALENQYYVSAHDIEDEQKNITAYDAVSLTVGDRADTSSPKLITTMPPDHSDTVDFLNTEISFYFDNEFDVEGLEKKISFSDTSGSKVNFSLLKIDNAAFTLKAEKKLKSLETYVIKYNFKNIVDAAGNSTDSVYQYNFKTFNGLNFTGFSGIVENLDTTKNPVLELQNKTQPELNYSKRLNKKGEFAFTRVEPGKYTLYFFYDTDSDGKYSPGFPFPYNPSEEIMYCTQEINLPPRWEVTDFKWDIIADTPKK